MKPGFRADLRTGHLRYSVNIHLNFATRKCKMSRLLYKYIILKLLRVFNHICYHSFDIIYDVFGSQLDICRLKTKSKKNTNLSKDR